MFSFETTPRLVSALDCCLLRGDNRISLDVHPIGTSCWDVTPQAIFFVVSRYLLVRGVGLEQRPRPSIAPERVPRVASFFVLDHHEPDLRARGPVRVACGHLSVIASKYFLHENRSVSELSGLTIDFSGAGRCVSDMHLVSL